MFFEIFYLLNYKKICYHGNEKQKGKGKMKKFLSDDIDVCKVADYILSKTDIDTEDYISNLKLQKLLYYCQGFILAITSKTLFTNNILAWEHGPVVKEVYDKYKINGAMGIIPADPPSPDYYDCITKTELKSIIDDVWDVYGQFSAWKLRNMTHEELPWKNTKRNQVISTTLLHKYFITQIEDDKEN